jgi:uncharacterized protein YfaS (alpha-2-macroglobulin family)
MPPGDITGAVRRQAMERHSANHPHLTPSRQFLSVFSVLMIVSLACNLPHIGRPSAPTPPADSTPAVVEHGLPAAQATLPPVVVETSPLATGSNLTLDGPITMYFNQAMDRASVEGALQADPPTPGRFEWVDDATVQFFPDQPFPVDSEIRLTLDESARGENGLAVQSSQNFSFQTAAPLRVAEVLPEDGAGEVDPTSTVAVTFNLPVVPLGETNGDLPPGFSLQPNAAGEGEWLNTSTYVFRPQPALGGGMTYTVQVNPDLTSTAGTGLADEQDLEWSFTTTLPRVLSVEPDGSRMIRLDAPIKITFNQPMDTGSAEEQIRLVGPDGQAVPLEPTWEQDNTVLTLTHPGLLERDKTYTLSIPDTILGLGGARLENPTELPLHAMPLLYYSDVDPTIENGVEIFYGRASIALQFTAPLQKGQDWESLVRVQPPVDGLTGWVDYEGVTLYLTLPLQVNQAYTLTLSPDIQDVWGGRLGNPVDVPVRTRPYRPTLIAPMLDMSGNGLFVTPTDISIPAQATNLTRLELASRPAVIGELLEAHRNYSEPVLGDVPGWVQTLNLQPDSAQAIDVALTPDLQPLPTGLYLMSLRAPEEERSYPKPPFFVLSSRVHLSLKVAAGELLVWAVNLDTNRPVTDLPLQAFDKNQNILGELVTDANGMARLALLEEWPTNELIAVTSGQPGDDLFALGFSHWMRGLTGWEMGVPTDYWGSPGELYLYTDRPIYQAGQTVYFRLVGMHRTGQGYRPMRGETVTLNLRGEYSPITNEVPLLETQTLQLSDLGTASGEYTLPPNAPPGYYSIEVSGYPASSLGYQVASYRKPEVEVEVALGADTYAVSERITAQATARYYFGGPAADIPVRWSLLAHNEWIGLPDGFQTGLIPNLFTDYAPIGMSYDQLLVEGSGTTDAQGSIEISISPEELRAALPADFDHRRITLQVTLTDESGRSVSGRDEAELFAAPLLVGIRPDRWSAQAEEELAFDVISADLNRQPLPGQVMRAEFNRVVWRQTLVDGVTGFSEPEVDLTLIGSTDFQTGSDGRARLAFTPPTPGVYQLEVRGGDAITQVMVWVGGSGGAFWPDLPDQRLKLQAEKTDLQPGETAQVLIPNPFPAGALAWITVERDQVLRSEVRVINEASLSYSLEMQDLDAPNVYLMVLLLGQNESGRPDFRAGIIELTVEPVTQVLNVQLTTQPEQAGPGEPVTISLAVADSTGAPVEAEFSLAVVDQALLALTAPNAKSIQDAFYGRQSLRVVTGMAATIYAWRIPRGELGQGGGGGGDLALPPEVRDDFKDTAYWTGTLVTGPDGTAQVDVLLPENLTTWEIRARGLDAQARVGEGVTELLVSKPLLLRPITPAYWVVGDHARLGAVVHNNTADDLAVEVSLQSAGLALDPGQPETQAVELAAGQRADVTWWATVQDVSAVDLVFTARSGELEDASTPDQGSLPVLRYLAPQTFGTAGILEEAGQRLEVVSLPRTFDPSGGALSVELNPSLAAVALSSLKALENPDRMFTESVISTLVPNAQMARTLAELDLDRPDLREALDAQVNPAVEWLDQAQNTDGGWGWIANVESDPFLSAYALLGLTWAKAAGYTVSGETLSSAQNYLLANLESPAQVDEIWAYDRLAFELFALSESGVDNIPPANLFPYVERLSPAGQAFLLAILTRSDPGSEMAQTLRANLQGSAVRSATGAHWQPLEGDWYSFSSPLYATAVVVYVLSQADPASPLLADAVRYLVTYRYAGAGWDTRYQTAWALLALTEYMQGTGELRANFSFAARVNDQEIARGQADGIDSPAVEASLPIADLQPDGPNGLEIERGAGDGRLYYRAYLQVERPVETVTPLEQGVSLQREYRQMETGELAETISLGAANPVIEVRLNLTVPNDMSFLVVEDFAPAGMEIINPGLRTSETVVESPELYDERNPFEWGWGWWVFDNPQITSSGVRWVAEHVPAGSYQLVYRLLPQLPGEYSALPAHAYAYFFREVQGTSAGNRLIIEE